MKITVNHHHSVAVWKWDLKPPGSRSTDPQHPEQDNNDDQPDEQDDDDDEDVCGICRVAFDGCCPDCKIPGDGCPPIWGECTHVFHYHCLHKWLATDSSKQQCPMDRRAWITAGTPSMLTAPGVLAAPPVDPQHHHPAEVAMVG
ncbi:hypothetical protein JCM11641_000180 [Rhodosporidiobolus odoratus]